MNSKPCICYTCKHIIKKDKKLDHCELLKDRWFKKAIRKNLCKWWREKDKKGEKK